MSVMFSFWRTLSAEPDAVARSGLLYSQGTQRYISDGTIMLSSPVFEERYPTVSLFGWWSAEDSINKISEPIV